MSRSLLALRRRICCPTAVAALRTSSISASALGLVGFTSMAISGALGTSSRSSASFFTSSSDVNRLAPVTLPPGRLRLATRPTLTGKSLPEKNDRNRRRRGLGRERRAVAACRDDHRHLTADQIDRHCRQSIKLSLRPAEFDRHILALDIASFVQTLTERRDNRCRLARGPAAEEPDHWHRRLLRTRRKRPCCRSTAEKCDVLAPVPVSP